MIYRLTVPLTIENNQEVRVLEWHAEPGDGFATGALIVELETQKALIDVRAGQAGILRQRHVEAGEWCPLGGLLATTSDDADEAVTGDGQGELVADFLIG